MSFLRGNTGNWKSTSFQSSLCFSLSKQFGTVYLILLCLHFLISSGSDVKHLPAMWGTRVQSLGREDSLEKEMATHSSILSWKIPWTDEPGRLQSMGSQRVRHDWATSFTKMGIIKVATFQVWGEDKLIHINFLKQYLRWCQSTLNNSCYYYCHYWCYY